MKATLKFKLPEEEAEHSYALAGLDALLAIDDLLSEIRSALRHNSGELRECDIESLEKVQEFLCNTKERRNLPELI